MKYKNIIFGINSVLNIINKNAKSVREIYIEDRLLKKGRLLEINSIAKEKGIKVVRVDNLEKRFNLNQHDNHQGVMAEIEVNNIGNDNSLTNISENANLILILDTVTDPQNLGACLRSAEVFGVDLVIIPKDKSASITPIVRKVACGGAELVNIAVVTNIARSIESLQKQGFWVVGAAGEGTASIDKFEFPEKTAIVMGSEGEGLRELTKKKCDFLVKIPMYGCVESLNVSVATGIFLYSFKSKKK